MRLKRARLALLVAVAGVMSAENAFAQTAYFSTQGDFTVAAATQDFYFDLTRPVTSAETFRFETFSSRGTTLNAAGETSPTSLMLFDSNLTLFAPGGALLGSNDDGAAGNNLDSLLSWTGLADSAGNLGSGPLAAGTDYRLRLNEFNGETGPWGVDLVGPANALVFRDFDPFAGAASPSNVRSIKFGTNGVAAVGSAEAHAIFKPTNFLAADYKITGGLVVANTGNASFIMDSTDGDRFTAVGGLIVNVGGDVTLSGDATLNTNAFTAIEGGRVSLSGTSRLNINHPFANVNSGGRIDVNAGATLSAPTTFLGIGVDGSAAEAQLVVTNGTVTAQSVSTGTNAGKAGRVVVTGANGRLTLSNFLTVGNNGAAALEVTAGGQVTNVNGFIAFSTGSVATANVSGAGSIWTNTGNLTLGRSTNSGVGTLTVNAGGRVNVGDASTGFTLTGIVLGDADLAGGNGGELFVYNGSTLTNASGGVSRIGINGGYGKVTVSGANSKFLHTNGSGLAVAVDTNAKGFLDILAGGSVESPDITVGGFNGVGTVLVSGAGSVLRASNNVTLSSPAGAGTGIVTTSSGGKIFVGDAAGDAGAAFGLAVADGDPIGTNGGVLTVANGSTLNTTLAALVGAFGTTKSGRVVVKDANSLWTNNSDILVGYNGTGELNVQSSGRVTTTNNLFIGSTSAGSVGTINLSAAGRIDSTFNTVLGTDAGTSGVANVGGTGSLLNVGTGLEVGRSGTATLNINAAGQVTAANATVGNFVTGVGTINLNGSGSLLDVEGDLIVGNLGRGTVNLNGGNAILVGDAATPATDLRIGDSDLSGNAGGNVTLNNQSTWTMNDVVRIGRDANTYGRLAINSGSTFSTNSTVESNFGTAVIDVTTGGRLMLAGTVNGTGLTLGLNAPGRGIVTVDGAGSLLDVNNSVRVGNTAGNAVSTLTIRNGGLLNVGDLAVPPMSPNGFSVHVSDANLDGLTGGVIDISPGSLLDASNDVAIAGALNSFGRINVNGTNARLKTATNLVIGGNGLGRLDVDNGGRAEAAGLFIFNGVMNVSGTGSSVEAANLSVGPTAFFSTPGTLNLSGGQVTVTTGGFQVAATGTLNLSGGTLVTPTFTRIAGSVVNFTGGTLVNHTFTGQLTQNGGINSPGNVGVRDVMTITGGYTQTSGALAADLFASNNDVISSNGPVVLGGALSLNNVSFPTTIGTNRILVDAPSVTGYFSTVSGLALSPTRYVAVTYGPNSVFLTVALPGDATLSNGVGFADLVVLAQNYNLTGRSWVTADFDGNGTTGFSDLVLLAQNYNTGALTGLPEGASADFAADWALAQSLVPEPSTLLALPLLMAIGRRRRPL